MLITEQLHALTAVAAMERRLFEVVGARASAATDPDEQRRLAVESRRHAWHASLWEARLPLLHDVDAQPPELPGDDGLVEELGRRYD